MIDAEGSLARVLAALPGAASPPPDLSGVEGLSFTLDPSSASEGTGALTLRYAPAATPEQRQRTSAALAAWIQTVSPGGLRLQASAGGTGADVLTIGAAGMEDVFKKLLRAAARAERAMKKEQEPEPDPKDQSSSTFQ